MRTARRTLGAGAMAMALFLGACAPGPTGAPDTPVVQLPPPPAYLELARAHNARVAKIGSFKGTAVLRLDYPDEHGERRREQGDGRIQLQPPDKLALDIGKVSQTFFWLGCDEDRYWWFDLAGTPTAVYFGTHDGYSPELARRCGIVVPPIELFRLLGIVPLPEEPGAGTVDWSRDGTMLGATLALESGDRQRIWWDAKTLMPRQVELFESGARPGLVASLERPVGIEVAGGAGVSVTIPGRMRVYHRASASLFILDIDDLTRPERGLSPKAFDLEYIASRLHPDKRVDLDERPPAGGGGR